MTERQKLAKLANELWAVLDRPNQAAMLTSSEAAAIGRTVGALRRLAAQIDDTT